MEFYMEYKSQILNEDKFKGNYIGTGGIILKGIFDGNLTIDDLTILDTGKFLGKLIAKNIIIHGTLKGDIEVEKITIKSTGVFEGELVYRDLIIEEGGFLNSNKVLKMSDQKAVKKFNSSNAN
ncbi:MAG: hypothetical protein CMN50_09910 [SAR116 cluster bacterium]|nr:hypothetical protein [SAR116 cluster bacterium]